MSTGKKIIRIFSTNGILLPFLIIFIGFSVASNNFLTASNILVILRQSVFFMVLGFGMTYVIAMGGIDLSVGAVMGITGLFAAELIMMGVNIYLAIVLTVVFGMVIGLGNGLLVAKVKVPDFIATLGTMSVLRGLIYVRTRGIPVYGLNFPEFQFFGQGYIGPIPFPIIVTILVFAVLYYVLRKTKFGRYTISIGSNIEAAKLVGIKTDKMKILVYILCGVCCAISGILQTSRIETAVATAGQGYEMDAIASAVLGGTSLTGGKANLIGTAAGAVLMATIRNGLNLLNVSSYWHQVVIGAFILLAVAIDNFSKKRLEVE
ncbi:MAG: ABC transporter permease [Clostridiaceae bacterium]|nr:ABC transporter permease [Clostridiaceae bacterium]